MPMVRAMRMLNAIEAGTTTGAQLQTLLAADPGRLAELNVLLGMRGQARRMAASSTAMTAVAASSTAMTAVVASSTAMTAVAASSTAMTAVAASSTAKMAVFNSDTAINAIAISATALTACRAATQYLVYATPITNLTTGPALIGTNAAASYLAVGTSTSDVIQGTVATIATRRAGSARVATNTEDATNSGLTNALGLLCLPMVTPFTYTHSGTASPRTGYVGMLRCDI